MNRIERLVEKKIREAMEQGEFDNLPGKGEPIDLKENPFEDPEMRMVYRLLRNAGFAPAFIEERKSIESEIEQARLLISRANRLYRDDSKSGEWERAKAEFRQTVRELNDRIRLYNLKTPSAVFHRTHIDPESEIAKCENRRVSERVSE